MTIELTRRAFVETSGLAGSMPVAGTTLGLNATSLEQSAQPTAAVEPVPAAELNLTLRINGAAHPVTVDPRTTLLDALREHLGLTGTKKGCDMGACGACTAHVGGRRVNACLLAVMIEGKEITTIEGLLRAANTDLPGDWWTKY